MIKFQINTTLNWKISKKLKVLDWDKLKKNTWYNDAMEKTGEWYCHLEGSNGSGLYDHGLTDELKDGELKF